jgi:hypothetical protein
MGAKSSSSAAGTREEFADKSLHVFGVGGTATIHLYILTLAYTTS